MISALVCLTAAVFFEARGESYDAQRAVADVVMNRVESPRWPDTICGVVYQRRAFSFTHDGLSDDPSDYSNSILDVQAAVIAKEISRNTIRGDRLGIPSTHYHATYVRPYWAFMYSYDGRVGDHLFYTAPAGL